MWQTENNQLYKKFVFTDFKEAFGFMANVAAVAEKMQHHPRWTNQWNTVELWLSTHNAGKVTDKDYALADAIDKLVEPQRTQSELAIDTENTEVKSTPSDEKSVSKAPQKPHVGEIKLYGDGGSRGNPGPSAGGFVILDMDNNILFSSGKYLGITTNNQAEYHSLKGGLEMALEQQAHTVHVFMDSLLVINQMKGIYKVKNRDLWPIYEAIKQLVPRFKHVDFTHVPRELNKLADGMVNETLDAQAGKNSR